jgi:hypothetical protein
MASAIGGAIDAGAIKQRGGAPAEWSRQDDVGRQAEKPQASIATARLSKTAK